MTILNIQKHISINVINIKMDSKMPGGNGHLSDNLRLN
jgi:hypothetical protein